MIIIGCSGVLAHSPILGRHLAPVDIQKIPFFIAFHVYLGNFIRSSFSSLPILDSSGAKLETSSVFGCFLSPPVGCWEFFDF